MRNMRSFYYSSLLSVALLIIAALANPEYRGFKGSLFQGGGTLIFNIIFPIKYIAALVICLPDGFSLTQVILGFLAADTVVTIWGLIAGELFVISFYTFGVQLVFALWLYLSKRIVVLPAQQLHKVDREFSMEKRKQKVCDMSLLENSMES